MNATVTKKSNKKSVPATGAKKPPQSAAPSKAKPASRAIGKAVPATKAAGKAGSAAKPASKTSLAKPKAITKPAKAESKTGIKKPVVKSALNTDIKKTPTKTAVKSVSAKTSAASVAKPAPVTTAAKKATQSTGIAKPSGTPTRPAAHKTENLIAPAPANSAVAMDKSVKSAARMSNSNAATDLTDKIEQTVVSKVREVATKTMKSTPAAPSDGALLTEAQILKMSEKEYMNPAQLAFFKDRLQQLERDLLKNAGETTEHLRETVLVPDPADRATIEEEHALELRTRDRERKLLKKVQQSIASIDSGDYGWCEETGEPIGIPRLLARPTATLSLEAQQRRELKQKLYGD